MNVVLMIIFTSSTLAFFAAGVEVFRKINCRQQFYQFAFFGISSKVLSQSPPRNIICSRTIRYSGLKAQSDRFKLEINLGESI